MIPAWHPDAVARPLVVLPRAALEPTLDVEAIFPGAVSSDVGHVIPADAAKPLGLATIAALPPLAHNETEICDTLATRRLPPLRIPADVADEDHFVPGNR